MNGLSQSTPARGMQLCGNRGKTCPLWAVVLLAGIAATFRCTAQEVVYPPHLAYLTDCRFANGIAMPQDECDAMRRSYADAAQKKAQQDAALGRAMERAEADRKADSDASAKRLNEAAQARTKLEAERQADTRKRQAKDEEEDRADEARERRTVNAQKAKCGGDYKAPRIGMQVARVEECVARLRMDGQINRADGVITTYRSSSGAYFHVMNGRVVAWGR